MAEYVKRAAPKRKTAARKTSTGRKSAARQAAPTLQTRVTQAGRSAFLASLGVCGTAFDQIQDRLKSVESRLETRRKKVDKLYADMVKRGEKVEQRTRGAIDIPRLDRAALGARLDRARARFEAFKETIGFKAAA